MSPKKVALVAGREFMAAVTNKGFVIGLLIMPIMFAVLVALMPRLMTSNSTVVRGDVALIDPTGRVAPVLRETITPESMRARRERNMARALNATGVSGDAAARTGALVNAIGAEFRLMERPADADLAAEKRWLTTPAADGPRPLALVVVKDDAVVPAAGAGYGSYDLFVPPNTSERVENELREALREAIVSARLSARQISAADVAVMTVVEAQPSVTVGDVERQTSTGFNRMVPFVFCGLLVFGVMIGAQTLMTSTVEEKSSRVIEVLLSAVSPLESSNTEISTWVRP